MPSSRSGTGSGSPSDRKEEAAGWSAVDVVRMVPLEVLVAWFVMVVELVVRC